VTTVTERLARARRRIKRKAKEVPHPFVIKALLKEAVFSATPKRDKVALFGLFFPSPAPACHDKSFR